MKPHILRTFLLAMALALIVFAPGCGEKKPVPDYNATATASSNYYATQAVIYLTQEVAPASSIPQQNTSVFPAAACVIAGATVGGIVFIYAQSRKKKGKKS